MKKFQRSFIIAFSVLFVMLSMSLSVQAAVTVGKPKIKSAEQTGENEVSVEWEKVTGAKGYQVAYRVKGDKWKSKSTTKKKLVVTDLTTGKTYQFKVRAYKSVSGKKKYGKYSSVKSVKIDEGSGVLSTFRKCYTISNGNTQVYSDTSLTKKYGTIFPSDELIVLTVTNNYARVTYPTSRGSKTGYIPRSAILTQYNSKEGPKRTKNITTYRRPGGATYGSIYTSDWLYVFGTSGAYSQVLYPVSGGSKYAFVKTSDLYPTLPSTTNLSFALYKDTKAYISCGFDGYVNTKGRHEGIDIKCGNGKSIYSLTDGTIVRVANGFNGSNGLSTIAIYSSQYNKTVIYLHSNPGNLKAGQTVKKGQWIGTEGWRGVSSSSGSHTHVEVRNGKQGYASKSVNDYTLDNPNPTGFWNSLGYTVK